MMVLGIGWQTAGAPGPEILLFGVAGFAASALFLVSLFVQVKKMAAEGKMPLTLPLLFFLRVGLVGSGIGAMALCGPWEALAGLAGFLAGRLALAGPVARRFEA
jgi:hypothetical protein